MSFNQLIYLNGGKDLPTKFRIMRLPEVKAMTVCHGARFIFELRKGLFRNRSAWVDAQSVGSKTKYKNGYNYESKQVAKPATSTAH